MTHRGLAPLALALLLTGSTTTIAADEPKLPDTKAFDKLVIDSLRVVHNKGADLFNTSKDFAGTFRLYQGALEAVRPLLAHRPDAQKIIDNGLAAADKETAAERKAFLLHETIESVRKSLKIAIGTQKPDNKKPEDKKPVDKNPKPAATTASVSGKITLAGKPLAAGEVTFVSLNLPLPRVFSAEIKADGSYTIPGGIPPGQYTAIVTGKGIPAKYQVTTTSALRFEFATGSNVVDLILK